MSVFAFLSYFVDGHAKGSTYLLTRIFILNYVIKLSCCYFISCIFIGGNSKLPYSDQTCCLYVYLSEFKSEFPSIQMQVSCCLPCTLLPMAKIFVSGSHGSGTLSRKSIFLCVNFYSLLVFSKLHKPSAYFDVEKLAGLAF